MMFCSRFQVQGIDRLRVADASVMPSVPSGNTNAPAVMVGERAADYIKQRWLGATNVSFILTFEKYQAR